EAPGDFRSRDDGAGRAVRYAAAIEQAERFGDHRCVEALLLGDRLLQMSLGILRAVGMAFHGHMRDRALEVFFRDAVLAPIGARKLREIPRSGAVGTPQRIERAVFALRQAAI